MSCVTPHKESMCPVAKDDRYHDILYDFLPLPVYHRTCKRCGGHVQCLYDGDPKKSTYKRQYIDFKEKTK
jgi:hypothetical protein